MYSLLLEVRKYLTLSLSVPVLLVLAHLLYSLFQTSGAGLAAVAVMLGLAFLSYEIFSLTSKLIDARREREQALDAEARLITETQSKTHELLTRLVEVRAGILNRISEETSIDPESETALSLRKSARDIEEMIEEVERLERRRSSPPGLGVIALARTLIQVADLIKDMPLIRDRSDR